MAGWEAVVLTRNLLPLACLAAVAVLTPGPAAALDQPQVIGEPFASVYPKKPYARNIWVMRLFQGRLYLGSGNSSNEPPAANAGPVPVMVYDPVKKRFEQEGLLKEEQIDRIVTIGKTLCIPGHDPTENWTLGNVHCRQEDGTWIKYRTLPKVIHAYDLTEYHGAMVAGVATEDGAALGVSRDHGQHWAVGPVGYGRTYSLMTVAGQLYAIKVFLPLYKFIKDPDRNYAVAEIGDNWAPIRRRDLDQLEMFPNTEFKDEKWRKIIRVVESGEGAFYIGANEHNDHQSLPFGLYHATSLQRGTTHVTRIPLPPRALPWDIVEYRGILYILTNEPVDGGYSIAVHAAKPDSTQPPARLAVFQSQTFARSFAVDDGGFYFGLGCEAYRAVENAPLSPLCGQLLRLPRVIDPPPQ